MGELPAPGPHRQQQCRARPVSTKQVEKVAAVRRWQRGKAPLSRWCIRTEQKGLQEQANGCCISEKEPLFIWLRARAPFGYTFSDQLGCLRRKKVELGLGVEWEVGSGGQRAELEGKLSSKPRSRRWCRKTAEESHLGDPRPMLSSWLGRVCPCGIHLRGLPSCGVELTLHRSWAEVPRTFTGGPQGPRTRLGSRTLASVG